MGKEMTYRYAENIAANLAGYSSERFAKCVSVVEVDKIKASYGLKYNLSSPEGLAYFIVDFCGSQIDALYDGIYEIKKEFDIDKKNNYTSAMKILRMSLDNPDDPGEGVHKAFDRIIECTTTFESKVLDSIKAIKEIHLQSNVNWFFLSRKYLKDCDYNNRRAVDFLNMLILSYSVLFAIGAYKKWNMNSLERAFDDCVEKICKDDNCLRMAEYSADEQTKLFWLELYNNMKSTMELYDQGKVLLSREAFEMLETNDQKEEEKVASKPETGMVIKIKGVINRLVMVIKSLLRF